MVLRWPPERIGRLTLRQLDLLTQRHLEQQDREDFRAALVACSFGGGKPEEIFPRLKRRELTDKERFAAMTRTTIVKAR